MNSLVSLLLPVFDHSMELNRATGRTTRMLENVKPGDVVVVNRAADKTYMNLDRSVKVIPVSGFRYIDDLRNHLQLYRRRGMAIHFDHYAIETLTRKALTEALKGVDGTIERLITGD